MDWMRPPLLAKIDKNPLFLAALAALYLTLVSESVTGSLPL